MTEPQQKLAGLSREERAVLIDLLRRKKEAEAGPRRIERRRDPASPPPLSFAQLRLWFLDRLHPGDPTYNLASATRIRGVLHLPSLALALAGVADRHEALRTTFAASPDGEPVQVIAPCFAPKLPVVDLGALPDGLRGPALRSLAAAEARRPFDLAAGPLLRACSFRAAEDEHVLLLVVHHIVGDGWSMGLLVAECVDLYRSLVGGRPAALPELPFQSADFAVWQRDWLRGEVLRTQVDYWKGHLGEAPPELRLPADNPLPKRRTPAGAHLLVAVPPALTGRLTALAREENGTLFVSLLAAFEALLHRLSGQDDFCVGTPIANRNQPGTERLIGLFVNTLALRADLSGDPPFRELVGRVRQAAVGAYAHQDLPFEKLVAELQPERAPGRNPLFQVMLSLQAGGGAPPELPGAEIEEMVLETGTARLDLALSLAVTEGGLAGSFEYSLDLFSAATLERLCAQLQTLLEGAAAAPDARLSELPLLGDAERFQLLIEWNDTRTGPAGWESVPRRIAGQAERTPAAVAVEEAGGESLTYRELRSRAAGLARSLRSLGIEPEAPVAVLLERTLALPPAILGVWEAGGAYLPLEPGSPVERLAYLLEDSGARVVVTTRDLAPALPAGLAVRVLYADEVEEEDSSAAPDPPPGRLVYILYTSGSTGRPKGVMVEHGSLAAVLLGIRSELSWTAADSSPCVAPFAFDISLFELLTPLLCGGRALLVQLRPSLDLSGLLRLLARITRLHAVPGLMRQIVDDVLARGLPAPALSTVLVGGDAVPGDLLADLRRAFPAAEIRVLYGPTEGTILCASHRVAAGDEGPLPLLGRPLPDAVLRVCDRAGNPVPIFAPGEIWIGGPGVSRGYLGQPELTAERFPVIAGERFYRTGDLARRRADGTLEFLGRADDQVKIRGFRIEPGEIEAALAAHPGLRAAAVVAREDGGERRLVAYVVAGMDTPPASAELREFLRGSLPEPMIPAAFIALPALPLTPNGKVDRRALARTAPAPEWGGPAAERVAPRTPAEEAVAAIFTEVLDVPAAGAHDDFFALGGHSLLAMRLVSRVRELLNAELPLRRIFETPTVAGIAAALEEESGTLVPPLRSAPREASPPLSFGQERVWFLDRLEPGNTSLNMPFSLRLRGRLEPAALARALAAVVARHEVLRTVYRDEGGDPRQVVRSAAAVAGLPLPVADLAALPASFREAEAARLAGAETSLPFDLTRGPVLRALLLRLEPALHILLLTVHHIAADGWSMGVLTRELAGLYAAFLAGRPSPLPALPVQYADFARWQRDWLQGEVLEAQLAWWRGRLGGAPPPLELPTDRPRPAVQTFRGAARQLALPAALAAGLRSLARREGASLFMVLLAAFQALLHRWSGQDDILVGAPIAGRRHTATEGLIGFFLNNLVLRADLAGNPGFRDLLARVREESLGAFAHQDVPFEALLADLQPARDLSRTPLFQVLFNMVDFPPLEASPSGLAIEPGPPPEALSKFDLTFYAGESEEGIDVQLVYNADLFDAPLMEELLEQYALFLEGVEARPEAGVDDVSLVTARARAVLRPAAAAPRPRLADLSRDERAALLRLVHQKKKVVDWNRTAVEYPRESTVPRLFAEQAERTPHAVALVTDEGVWTYGELAAAAGRLACRLRRLGVGTGGEEVPVAVLAERSPELVAAFLGVLAAGGFFVPLDPAHPPERLDALMTRVGTRVAVTAGRRLPLLPAAVTAVCLDHPQDDPDDEADRPFPAGPAAPESLAYVMFTSGSTGEPKGVAVTHRNILRLVRGQSFARFGPGEVWAQLAPASFDASTLEIWGPLLNGGSLAIFPPHPPSLPELAGFLARHRVTSLWLTAGLFHQMAAGQPAGLAPLRRLLAGGDVLSPALVRRVLAELPGLTVVNGYGPTEGTTFTCCWEMSDPGAVGETVPLGRPIANTRAYVLDARAEPVPAGVRGELWAGGDGLARGYFGRPDLTAERFVPDPFADLRGEPGARLYRTGDLVRHRSDGLDGSEAWIEFLGRDDRQVKIRGFRVEPAEVEAALAAQPRVREAAVVAVGGRGADASLRLVAYLVPQPGLAPEPGALRAGLARTLPEPMIPGAIVLLDRLPLTANGKVDRGALERRPLPAADRGGAETAAPRDEVEARLAGIWRELLGVESVGVEDNFFSLGGHSLLAARLMAAVHEAYGVEIPLPALFERPTLAELALAVTEARFARAGGDAAADLLEELEGLSDEEAARRLGEAGETAP
jgi:amino acid adenylation domain-containing protein